VIRITQILYESTVLDEKSGFFIKRCMRATIRLPVHLLAGLALLIAASAAFHAIAGAAIGPGARLAAI
jgi:hypothetical protein